MDDTSHHLPKDGRLFWPIDMMDEWMPPGQRDPDSWIVKDDAGAFWLRDKEDDDPEGGISIAQGQKVHFFYEEDRRAAAVDFDGVSITGGWDHIPAHHNIIWNNDLEIHADNKADAERQMASEKVEPGSVDLNSAFHNVEPIWFEFSATFGPPRLIPCAPPPETAAVA